MTAKILVVDDEEALCQLFVKRFTLEGFEVAAARSGPEALILAEREPPDLIVLDLIMPGMDGIETLRRFRQQGSAAKVVILTGHGTPQRAREAMALGAREFFGKPFDLDRLLRVVVEEVGEGTGLQQHG